MSLGTDEDRTYTTSYEGLFHRGQLKEGELEDPVTWLMRQANGCLFMLVLEGSD